MLRATATVLVISLTALLGWLAFAGRAPRADFVVASDELRTIDPQRVSLLDEIQVTQALFEGLTRLHPLTLQPEPAVAASWDFDAARSTYTFHLRPEARWSNGDPVLAEHFRAAWLRALDPHTEAQYASLLFVINGAEAYYRSCLNDDPGDDLPADRVGVDAPDGRTLRVHLANPCPYFLDLTSFPTLAPVHPPTLGRFALPDGREDRSRRHLWTRPENIVCNGAFVLERWDFKRRLLLRRNPHYWDRDSVGVETIEVSIVSPNAALIGYEVGRIDLVRTLEPETAAVLFERLQAGQRDDFHVGDRFATYFFRVNCKRPPLDNPDLRKALSLAIDKPALCEHILGLGETPADTYVPRAALRLMPRQTADDRTVYYQPPAGLGAGLSYAQRVALAREHLRRSGFDPLASRPIELAYAPEPPIQRRIAEAVQAMWEPALGIRVELRVLERKVLSEKIRNLDYDLARSDWYGDYLDPLTFLDLFTSASGQNRTGWENAEYDRLIAAAVREQDDARRFALLAEAERILCEQELPIVPLYFKRGNYLLRPTFTGVMDNVRDLLPIHRVQRRG